MARKIAVEIVGDSASLERSFQRASHSATQFERNITHAARGAISGSGAFEHLGRSLAFASGGFVAFAGVTEFLRSSVDAAREAAVGQRALAAQIKVTGQSFAANKEAIDKASLAVEKYGFTSEESERALTVLVRGTGNVTKAIRLQQLTADLARAKNLDLASAANVVAKVFGGQETALRRAVPGLEKTAHGMDLIRLAGAKLAGQARANTTEAEKFHAVLHNTEVIIGSALLPVLDKLLTHLGNWLQKMNESGRLQRDVNAAVKTGTQIFNGVLAVVKPLAAAFKALGAAVGGTKNEIELLAAAFVAFKAAKVLNSITTVSTGITGIGNAAEASRGKVLALRSAILAIPTLALTDIFLGKKALTQQATAGDVGGANKSPFVKGSEQNDLFQAGLAGKTGVIKVGGGGTIDLAHLNDEGRQAFFAGLKERFNQLFKTAGGGTSTSSLNVPSSLSGMANSPLNASQKLQAQLALHPNDINLLQQQAAHDRAAIAFANKLRAENRISNAKWVQEVTAYGNDLNSTLGAISSIQSEAARKAADARKRAAAAAKALLGRDVPDFVSGAGSTVQRLFEGFKTRIGFANNVGGTGAAPHGLLQHFNIPVRFQMEEAKAAALGDQDALRKIALAEKHSAQMALKNFRLTGQAYIDAWNVIAGANQTLGTTITHTAHAVSSRILTAGLGLNRDTRKALESRLALAGAFSGHVPTTMGVLGQSVHVQNLILPNVTDTHSFADELGKLGRTKPVQTSGHNAGRSRALP